MLIDDAECVLQRLGVMIQRLDDVVICLLPCVALKNKSILHGGDLLKNEGLELVVPTLSHARYLLEFGTELLIPMFTVSRGLFESALCSQFVLADSLGDGDLSLSPVEFLVLECVLHAIYVLRDNRVLVFDVLNILLPRHRELSLHGTDPVSKGVNVALQPVESFDEDTLETLLNRGYLGTEHSLQRLVRLNSPLDLGIERLLQLQHGVFDACDLVAFTVHSAFGLHLPLALEVVKLVTKQADFRLHGGRWRVNVARTPG
eukprot:CAMPEP_0194519772 /NCGR_PEP_ID=MMETSP0253-20130528/53526_1 /TAXON_ID=2966 /ORGANISM="Noctiluca scintillans" /LENGTH=259 /DNA_ID=CAMNT_0039363941 /DNA_START=94 /DNA_END=870 /DNA_ORIENTATION=+